MGEPRSAGRRKAPVRIIFQAADFGLT